MVFSNNLLLGAAGAGAGYTIDQSIRFNKTDNSGLTVTPSAGNRDLFTLSVWFKLGLVTSTEYRTLFCADTSNTFQIYFLLTAQGDYLRVQDNGVVIFDFSQSLRDPSAWYHLVYAYDSAQATAADRCKAYLNGEEVTDLTSVAYPAQNVDSKWNSAVVHGLGYRSATDNWDGYLAEIHHIEGTALDPTSFGEYNDDGVWIPKAYTGSYGTNGFYITGATASDLGEDFSGNNNDFTSTGLATTDQMLDTPTDNWSTWNPTSGTWIYPATFSDGNLTAIRSGSGTNIVGSTISFPATGNWYAEFTIDATGSGSHIWQVGIIEVDDAERFDTVEPRLGNGAKGYAYTTNWSSSPVPNRQNNGSAVSYGTGGTATNVIGVHLNNGTLVFYHNNVSQGTAYSSITGEYIFAWSGQSGAQVTANFGQKGFTYTPPSSAVAVTAANLATPSITDGSAHMQTLAYASTGTITAFVQDGNSQFEPGLVWEKSRTGANNHLWFDQVRGATKFIRSDTTNTENTVADTLTSFNSNGFTAGADSVNWGINYPGRNNVAWMWKANGAGSSNEDGSINTTATSVNTTAGFSISTYTGTGANATVGHGLGIAPSFVLIKSRNDTHDWYVWTPALATTEFLQLNSTAAKGTASPEVWNSTAPTSSVVSLGTSIGVNRNTYNYVMYCFAEVEGFSSIGSYTGNGSTDGPFVYTGFKPAFVIFKNISASDQSWEMFDNKRDGFNDPNRRLYPNASDTEPAATDRVRLTSNGFKIVTSVGTQVNGSGNTIIYMAFAENPFGGDGVAPATAR